MKQEEFEQLRQYEWDKFSRRYPAVTSTHLIARIMLVFGYKGSTAKMLWDNGFLSGVIWAYNRMDKEL